VTKIIPLIITNFVTPKVGAKHELLFNEPASGVMNKLDLSLTRFITIIVTNFIHLCLNLKTKIKTF
jgi:hypothetical protein